MATPAFSICVPNYNYEGYLGETLHSALDQTFPDLEVVVADNASTDGSVAVIEGIDDERLRHKVNRCNVGFAGNLVKSTEMATGERMILLSSDDLIDANALETYHAVLSSVPAAERDGVVLISRYRKVDGNSNFLEDFEPAPWLWGDAALDPAASDAAGVPVKMLSTRELLRRSLLTARNPLPFLSVCYSRAAFQAIEGYAGVRHINPDKLFAFRLMAATRTVFMVDAPLFSYRWHDNNQGAQQSRAATLKFLCDEYASTFDLPPQVLDHAGVTKAELVDAFLKHDVGLYHLRALAHGDRHLAKRALRFARATYPEQSSRSAHVQALRVALALGPVGQTIARIAEGPVQRWWRANTSV